MSDTTITVSDGEDFYQIPLEDLAEAVADGFYVPAIRGMTIVSDGEEMFEIPVDDLPEATADGFIDTLVEERGLLPQVRSILNGSTATSSPATGAAIAASSEFNITTESESGKQSASPATSPRAAGRKAGAKTAAANVAGAKAESGEDRESAADEDEEGKSGIARFLSADGPLGGSKTWQVMAINVMLHAAILLVLALIIMPLPEMEVFMEISSAFEPPDPVEMSFEAVELEQPEELDSDPVEMEVVNPNPVNEQNDVDIDVSDMPLNIPESLLVTEAATGPITTSKTGELSGRSEAGRAAAVARRGGNAASEAAVTQGLMWLATHQYEDGGWSYNHALGECEGQCTQPGSLSADCRNAATGMALLAMLGAGQTPFVGDFQDSCRAGVGFLLKNSAGVQAGLDMRAKHAGNTGMYTQAIAATALCETLGMLQHNYEDGKRNKSLRSSNRDRQALIRQLRPAAIAAIAFIVNAQHQPSGGWGYNPGTAGDTSILGWQIMALKSAAHAKIPIPTNTVAGANKFLTSVQTDDGYFGYRGPEKKPSTTAIGIISRMLSGMPRSHPLLKMGVNHLSARGPDKSNMYYNYYATQVMMHYGGTHWTKWNAVMRDHLVNTQIKEGHAAGSWNLADTHGGRGGRLYMTCLCTMTLEVYYRHLPLYGEPDELEPEITSMKE